MVVRLQPKEQLVSRIQAPAAALQPDRVAKDIEQATQVCLHRAFASVISV